VKQRINRWAGAIADFVSISRFDAFFRGERIDPNLRAALKNAFRATPPEQARPMSRLKTPGGFSQFHNDAYRIERR